MKKIKSYEFANKIEIRQSNTQGRSLISAQAVLM